jgi:hypothetical protein
VLTNIKRVAAVILALCFFLPLSQCEVIGPTVKEQEPATATTAKPQETQKSVTNISPAGLFSIRDPGAWLTVLAFFWPLISVLVSLKYSCGASCTFFEPLLSVGTLYLTWLYVAELGNTLPAGYVAFAAACSLVYVTAYVLVKFLREGASPNQAIKPPASGLGR